jgi:hypothetical protein
MIMWVWKEEAVAWSKRLVGGLRNTMGISSGRDSKPRLSESEDGVLMNAQWSLVILWKEMWLCQ